MLLILGGNEIKIVSEHVFLVQQDYEYFMINRNGQRILPDAYSNGFTFKGGGYSVLARVKGTDKAYLLTAEGEKVLEDYAE